MADNVLGEQDREWIESKRDMVMKFAAGEWAGDISMDDRAGLHRIAQILVGFGFMANWTCGSCIQRVGVYIKNGMGWH